MANENLRDLLLCHKGHDNPITAREIALALGLPTRNTQFAVRQMITAVMQDHGIPICSNSRGFFVAETADELLKYERTLIARQRAIRKRQILVSENFSNWCLK